jgi:hypothetical protein
MPEMLPVHDLPQVLNASGIFSNKELRQILNRPDHSPRVPFQSGFPPSKEARLIRFDPDKNPVSHPGMAYKGLDCGDFHVKDGIIGKRLVTSIRNREIYCFWR